MNGHEAEHHNAEHHNAEHHNAEHHNAEHHNAEHHNFDYDPGYPQTYEGDFDNAYDRVTAGDIADLLHHLAEMRCNTPPASTTSSIPPSGQRSCPARPTCSPGSHGAPSGPGSTTTAGKSGRWPPTPALPPNRPSCSSHSHRWGQIREEHPTTSSQGMEPDHRRTPGPVLVDTAIGVDRSSAA